MTPPTPRGGESGRGGGPRSRRLVVAVVLVGMLVLAGLAALLARTWRQAPIAPPTVEETRPVRVDGPALPRFSDSGPDPAVGQRIPVIEGASFDGRSVRIADDGHAKVIVFLAHWCPHCQRETPVLVAWLRSGVLPAGVEVYAVATATRRDSPNYPPSAWLEREQWPGPVLADSADAQAAHALGLSAFPFFVFVNARNEVAGRWSGELPITDLEQQIRALAASTPRAGQSGRGYTVGREGGTFETADGTLGLSIRTTRIFRLVKGDWRQVHRHGSVDDPALLAAYQGAVRGRGAGA